MTAARAPETETPMVDGRSEPTSWDVALERLQHPAPGQNHWLATVRPDGTPHMMPIIAFWIDGAFHFLVGPGTRKARPVQRAAADRGRLVTTSWRAAPMKLRSER